MAAELTYGSAVANIASYTFPIATPVYTTASPFLDYYGSDSIRTLVAGHYMFIINFILPGGTYTGVPQAEAILRKNGSTNARLEMHSFAAGAHTYPPCGTSSWTLVAAANDYWQPRIFNFTGISQTGILARLSVVYLGAA
jgi:hypothetical protein